MILAFYTLFRVDKAIGFAQKEVIDSFTEIR